MLHPRNPHKSGYDMAALKQSFPALTAFIEPTPDGRASVDFSNPAAVKALNAALLAHHYHVSDWDIPNDYLCPPIPGRADYIHHLADLLAKSCDGQIPQGRRVRGLDIGTGANCIYPLLGQACYGWTFVASDIDDGALAAANRNVIVNDLGEHIEVRKQANPEAIFDGLLSSDERFAFSLCNPPFHPSAEQAAQGSARKLRNLGKAASKPLNFGGKSNELWCPGGETAFIRKMIRQSQRLGSRILWYTSLVSKQENLRPIKMALKAATAAEVRIVTMGQGQKISRFIAWSFIPTEQQSDWWKQR
jgi:23S rRNA (adenine1618-N6)-methyltransferase